MSARLLTHLRHVDLGCRKSRERTCHLTTVRTPIRKGDRGDGGQPARRPSPRTALASPSISSSMLGSPYSIPLTSNRYRW